MMRPRSTLPVAMTLVALILTEQVLHVCPNAAAAPPAGIESRILRIDVPADRPDVWFGETKSLVAVQRDEFDRLLALSEAERPGPRPAQLTTAHYSATLAGKALRNGQARLEVQRVDSSPALLPLGQFNLAVKDLAWPNRPAIWGTDATGHSWLWADVPRGEIELTWSAAGRSLANELHFDLQLPAAAISSLDLRVPRDQNIRSTPEARRVDEGSDASWQVWRIQLGSERTCHIATFPTMPNAQRKPAILFEHELGAIVREQDLRFQTVFQVEVFDAPVTELTFTVPSSVDVYAVTYGQDVPLQWTRTGRSGVAGMLSVQLPGPLLGRSRPIRIDGVAQKPNTSMISPQIAVKDGIFGGGRHTLTIVAPLQLRSFRPTGFRQQTPATNTPEGESYTFVQMIPDAQLVLEVGRPQASLTAQLQALFEMNDSAWTLTSEFTWTASSGGVFQTECQFPAEWEITDVRLPSELGTARLAGWDATIQAGGQSLLTVEFLEALAPTVPRTVRVLARRRPVATGAAFPLPLPHPLNCYSVESTLGMILPSAFSPFVSDDSRMERISPPDQSSAWAIRPRRMALNQNEFWYRRESTEAGGSLQLVSRLRRVVASSETEIVASPADYTETYRIVCQTEGAPIDRLLVYLTQPGNEIRWSILEPRQGELIAQRMPVAQHADWNCPATGELWELRLPPLPVGSIHIEARRENRWLPSSRPALLVVPQAIDQRARVTLRHPASLDLLVETNALDNLPVKSRPAPGPDDTEDPEPPSAISAIENEQTHAWSFDNPAAQMSLTMRNPERSSEFPTMVSMRLRSLMSANPQGFDLYRAQIRLENGTPRDELRIRLPASAILQQVTIAGQATVPNRQGNELLFSDLNSTRRDVVELLYRVPSRGGGIRNVHRIVVPHVSATVLGFAWEFALPPSVQLHAEPVGVRLTRSLPESTWRERFFGPLGRPADEAFFNPFAMESWRELLRTGPLTDKPGSELSHELITPAEWQVHEAISVIAPEEIVLETWQSPQTGLLAWISLVVNLMLGIILRMMGWKYRDRIAAYWLALLATGAIFFPAPYAGIVGGAIAGTVIALLSPRQSLITLRRDPSLAVPLGSTHSFDWGKSAGLLAFVLTASAFAQETSVPPMPASTTPAGASPDSPDKRYTVLVPVDSNGMPSSELRLVYLPPQLLTALNQAAQAKSPPPQSLIASAEYRVTTSPNGADSLTARFRVHVLDTSMNHQILLPIANAFLTGTEACTINGKPHPAQIAPDGRGFVVTWEPRLSDPSDLAGTTASFDIELDLKRVGIRTALGGSFVATGPAVAASRWTLTLPDPAGYFDFAGARGATQSEDDQRTFQIDAGSTTSIDARWSQNPPEPRPQRIEVSQLQFLDLRSTHGELRFRLRCEPLDSQFDFIDIDLPTKSLIREGDIRAANMLRAEVIYGPDAQSRLRILFNEPQRQKFVIDGTILIGVGDGITHWPLPQFGLSRTAGLKVSMAQNLWCVSAPLEYKLEHQNLDADLLGLVSSTEFLQAWGDSPPTGRPQLIFQPREGSLPKFTVTPQTPRRRVLSWNQTGTVGKRRLEWTVSARLETSQARGYQHFLLVDRRLQIESISVVEGGAERLVRWSENRTSSPTSVVLFLSDKTTGIQQLTFKGSLPTRYGRATPLPFVRCEEAELVESRWELFRDPDVEVDLTLPRGVPPFEFSDEPEQKDGRQLVASYQTSDPDPKASIRVSAVQAPCTTRTAAALIQDEGSSWKLEGQLKLTPEGDSPRRVGVQFPVSFDPARIRVDRAEANWHEPVDGRRRLDLTLHPDPGEVLISFEAVVEEPAKGDWELPLPEPQEATAQQLHLMITPADGWTPLEGTELKPDESPNWAAEILSDLRPETSVAAEYQLGATPVRLRRSQTAANLDQPAIRLLDHSLWLTEQGGRHGITRAYLSQTRDAIQFDVPDGFRTVAVFLDDRPLSLPVPVGQKLQIPLVGGARESLLVVTWEQPPAQAMAPARLQSQDLPHPSNIKVVRTLVTVVPDRDELIFSRQNDRRLDWMGASLDRLEMLLARQESLGNDPRAAADNRRLILDLQLQITAQLPRGIAHPTSTLPAHLARWNRIVAALNQLEPQTTSRSTTATASRVMQIEEPHVDLPQALRASLINSNHSVEFLLLDRRWVNGIGALLLCLIAIPLFRRLIRLDWGEWLNTRTTLAWLLLGMVWWLCLSPGPIGPLIITIAILRAAMQRRQARHSVFVVDEQAG